MPTKIIDGQTVNYKLQTDGARKRGVLLFLHGFGGDCNSFAGVADFFCPDFHVLTPDLCGFGASEPPKRAFSSDDYAEITAKLVDEIKREVDGEDLPLYVIAHSFGGRVALRLMRKRAKGFHISKCVLCGSAGLKSRKSVYVGLKTALYKLLKILKRKAFHGLDLSGFGSADYRSVSPEMKPTFCRIIREDFSGELRLIDCPTLLVFGERDGETPLYMARRFLRGIKNSGLVVFGGCGHFCYIERTPLFCAVVANFFGCEKGGVSSVDEKSVAPVNRGVKRGEIRV